MTRSLQVAAAFNDVADTFQSKWSTFCKLQLLLGPGTELPDFFTFCENLKHPLIRLPDLTIAENLHFMEASERRTFENLVENECLSFLRVIKEDIELDIKPLIDIGRKRQSELETPQHPPEDKKRQLGCRLESTFVEGGCITMKKLADIMMATRFHGAYIGALFGATELFGLCHIQVINGRLSGIGKGLLESVEIQRWIDPSSAAPQLLVGVGEGELKSLIPSHQLIRLYSWVW